MRLLAVSFILTDLQTLNKSWNTCRAQSAHRSLKKNGDNLSIKPLVPLILGKIWPGWNQWPLYLWLQKVLLQVRTFSLTCLHRILIHASLLISNSSILIHAVCIKTMLIHAVCIHQQQFIIRNLKIQVNGFKN